MKFYLGSFLFFAGYNIFHSQYTELSNQLANGAMLGLISVGTYLVGEMFLIGSVKPKLPNKIQIHFNLFTKIFLFFTITFIGPYLLNNFFSEGTLFALRDGFILGVGLTILITGFKTLFEPEALNYHESTSFSIGFNHLYSHCIKAVEEIKSAIIYKKDREAGVIRANVKDNTPMGGEEIEIDLKKLTTDEVLVKIYSESKDNTKDSDYGKNRENVTRIITYLEDNIT